MLLGVYMCASRELSSLEKLVIPKRITKSVINVETLITCIFRIITSFTIRAENHVLDNSYSSNIVTLWPFPFVSQPSLRQIARMNGRVRLRIQTLLKRTVINYAVVICLAMATQFLLNLLTFIGLCSAFITVIVHYVCAIAALNYDAYIRSRVVAGFDLSPALTVDDGRLRIAMRTRERGKKKQRERL